MNDDNKYLTKREFDNFRTNEFYHLRGKVDWILYTAMGALLTAIGTLVTVILK